MLDIKMDVRILIASLCSQYYFSYFLKEFDGAYGYRTDTKLFE